MLYALIVGINRYASSLIQGLNGCENDARRMQEYLKNRFPESERSIRLLLSEKANKAAIVAEFRTHLAQAGPGDVALFYFSGHGCLEPSPQAFLPFQADTEHENLVCYDSEMGSSDLADKEIKLLLNELSLNGPEIVVIYDCCHAGSGTRTNEEQFRKTRDYQSPRAIQDFLPGTMENLSRPAPRHVFMAASDRKELSRERIMGIPRQWTGLFSFVLMRALKQFVRAEDISYYQLGLICRKEIERIIGSGLQSPRVEAVGGFDSHKYFLRTSIGPRLEAAQYIIKANKAGQWFINIGYIHGLKTAEGCVFRILGNVPARASILTLGLTESEIHFEAAFNPPTKNTYKAIAESLSFQKLKISVHSSWTWEWVQDELQRLPAAREYLDWDDKAVFFQEDISNEIELTLNSDAADYQLIEKGQYLCLQDRNKKALLGCHSISKPASGEDRDAFLSLMKAFQHMAHWQRLWALGQNQGLPEGIQIHLQTGGKTFSQLDGEWLLGVGNQSIPYKLTIQNQSEQSWFVMLYYLSAYFQVELVQEIEMPSNGQIRQLDHAHFSLPIKKYPHIQEMKERFLLVLSDQRLSNLGLDQMQKVESILFSHRLSPTESLKNLVPGAQGLERGIQYFFKGFEIKLIR